jgi:putative DNA primase/helicase
LIASIVANAQPMTRPEFPAPVAVSEDSRRQRDGDRMASRRMSAARPDGSPDQRQDVVIEGAPDSAQRPDAAPPDAAIVVASETATSRAAPSHTTSSSPPPLSPRDDAFDLEATLAKCALLDHSDTDNGERLRAYFGRDLTVRAEAEVPDGSFLCWIGTHWDIEGGAAGASLMAQEVGPLIKREADFLRLTSAEEKTVAAAADARAEFKARRCD